MPLLFRTLDTSEPQIAFSEPELLPSQGLLIEAPPAFGYLIEAFAATDPAFLTSQLHADAERELRQGGNQEAVIAYRRILHLDPWDATALNNLAVAWMRQGDYTHAAEILGRLLYHHPAHEIGRRNLQLLFEKAVVSAVPYAP